MSWYLDSGDKCLLAFVQASTKTEYDYFYGF